MSIIWNREGIQLSVSFSEVKNVLDACYGVVRAVRFTKVVRISEDPLRAVLL